MVLFYKNISIFVSIGILLLICILVSLYIDNYNSVKVHIFPNSKESFYSDSTNPTNPTIIPKQLIDMNDKLTNIELILSGLKEPINNNYDNKIKYENKKPYKASVKHYYG
jgi:hypothetical protein